MKKLWFALLLLVYMPAQAKDYSVKISVGNDDNSSNYFIHAECYENGKTLLLKKIIKKASGYFSANYARDYVSKMTFLRTIKTHGIYREFTGFQGLFGSFHFNQSAPRNNFDDDNLLTHWAPLEVMQSDAFSASGQDALTVFSVHSDSRDTRIMYNNCLYSQPLVAKRSLEIFSPLNPKQIKNFTYSIAGSYTDNGRGIIKILFRTKKGAFPDKTRIYGQGYIYIDENNAHVVKVVTEGMQDQFSNFLYGKSKYVMASLTQHKLEVRYATHSGKIFTETVSMHIDWAASNEENPKKNYYIQMPARRNPVVNRLQEYYYYDFPDFTIVQPPKEKRGYSNKAKFISAPIGGAYMIAPFDQSKWEDIPMPGIDRKKLFSDLSANGVSLYDQANNNSPGIKEALLIEDGPNKEYILNTYYKYVREITYPYYYKEEYK